MKRLRFETLLSPASLSREAALLLLGFRMTERSVERMGGFFRFHSQNIAVGRAAWAAELMVEIFWSQFLWSASFVTDSISVRLKPGADIQLSFAVSAVEREQLLESLRRQDGQVLNTVVLARSPSGLVVGEVSVGLRVRSAAKLLEGNTVKPPGAV